METRAKYVIVGSFVLTLLVGVLVAIVWLSNYDFTKGQIYAIYFEGSVSGLRQNELVTYNGVPIGSVKKIDIDPKRLENIRVLVEIDHPHLIRKNSKASLEAKGISGNLFIRIHASAPDDPLLCCEVGNNYPTIKSEYSKFQQLLLDAPKIIHSFVSLSDKIVPFFDEDNRQSFKKTLSSLSSIAQTFDKTSKGGMYEFSQLIREIRNLSSDFNRVLKEFENNPRQFLLQSSQEEGHVITP